jgi:hypothetical protein
LHQIDHIGRKRLQSGTRGLADLVSTILLISFC